MVTVVSDGHMGGMARRTLEVETPTGFIHVNAAVYDPLAAKFTVPGSVDAQIDTRIQYTVPYGEVDGHDGWQITSDLNILPPGYVFAVGDYSLGGEMSASVYLVKADVFDPGVVPTPHEILSVGFDTVPYRAVGAETGEGIPSPGGGPFGFLIVIPAADLEPNTKYWALCMPVAIQGTDPREDRPLGNTPAQQNALGRALSFWTNRTPLAPVITSPPSGTVVTAGTDVTFAFRPSDPDALPGAPGDHRTASFADMSGLQVQYAPRPTVAEPDPEWTDLPIAGTELGIPPTEGLGWFIEYANADGESISGAKQLRDTKTMQIRCGGTSLKPGYGVLPSGVWQLRMRTFDYGHPISTVIHGDLAAPGYGPTGTQGEESPHFSGEGPFPDPNLTPDTMPEVNTSPWSAPVNITVSTQVPPPLPLSPINNIAITEGTPVTLRWKPRNTHKPPLTQEAREVQIRKVGEADWTTLVSGNNADPFYSVTDMSPGNGSGPTPQDPPHQYLSDPDFEGGTTSDWLTLTGTLSNEESGGTGEGFPHTGDHFLQMSPVMAPAPLIYQFVDLREEDKFFTYSVWAFAGTDTDSMIARIGFQDEDDTDLAFHAELFDLGGGWRYKEFVDIPLPIGAVKALIQVTFATNAEVTNEGNAIDDASFLGSPTSPVSFDPLPEMDLPTIDPQAYALEATTHYQWRVRIADSGHVTSDWSTPASFWIVPPPGSGPVVVPGDTIEGATLGCGTHRVEVYRRGGLRKVGELTQLAYVDWNRLRDDISGAKVIVSGWDIDCGNLLARLQTWAYELKIWRNNGFSEDCVWEGPITLLTYENDRVTIHADDVIRYLYRRIIKQAMNDSGDGDTVVSRATRITQNVLAPDDPNVLAYLQPIENDNDAREFRNLPEWSRTAYEEIDDMAANAGLDYTAVGRAILYWGTKNRIGTLPELRDENLGSSPIVSEYGMSMADVYSVSDGNGVHGEAYRLLLSSDEPGTEDSSDEVYGPDGIIPPYGLVEMLSSSWASDSEEDAGVFTEEGLETVRESFEEFAERSIADRYPPPVVVRVPDNTTLHANTPVSIQQLVPGVVIPLRSGGTLRVVRANQKLDSMKVVDTGKTETISITLSAFNHEDSDTGDGSVEE